jgi:tetratricopeptide (TPR) repeat protein
MPGKSSAFGGFPDKIANIMETHNIDEKIRKLESQIKNAASASLYVEKGMLLKQANRLGDAMKSFETALTMDPKNVTANEVHHSFMKIANIKKQLGLMLSEQQQDEEKLQQAAKYLENAISESPNLVQANTALVSIYMKYKCVTIIASAPAYTFRHYTKCIPLLENLVKISPKNYLFHKQLGHAFLQCHKYYDAFLSVSKAVELFGEDLALILVKCDILSKLEQHQVTKRKSY